MTCAEFDSQVEAFVLGALAADDVAAMERHLAACGCCSDRLATALECAGSLRQHARSLAVDRGAGIMDAVLRDRAMPQRIAVVLGPGRLRGNWRIAVAAAAAMAIAAFGLWMMDPRGISSMESVRVECSQGGDEWMNAPPFPCPTVRGSRVFAFQTSGGCLEMVALNRRSGRELWRVPLNMTGAMLSTGDRVYVLESPPGRRLMAVKAEDGTLEWAIERGSDGGAARHAAFTLTDDAVFWAEGNRLFSVSRSDGSSRWMRSPVSADILALAAGPAGLVFAVSEEGVNAIRAIDGSEVWASSLFTTPAGDVHLKTAGNAVVLAYDGGDECGWLASFDAVSGKERWGRKTGRPSGLTVLRGRVYVKSKGLEVFSSATGAPAWSADVPGGGPAAENGGVVYIAGGRTSRGVMAFDADRGILIRSWPIAGACGGVASPGEWGFFRGLDGDLYALQLGWRG